MTETIHCLICGHELPAGARFCTNCGTTLQASQPAPVLTRQPAAPPPPARKSNTWIWVLGVIGLCFICILLVAGLYFVLPKVVPDMDLPNPFASKTPTATLTYTPTNTATMTSTPTLTNTPTITLTPTLGIGTWRIRNLDGMVEILIPAGDFIMGSSTGDADEMPVHTVWMDDYWIDQTEVTNGQYALCVDAGACDPPQQTNSVTRSSYFYNTTYRDYPVIWATWDNAYDYCDWVGGYLPTEAEWEKAARGETGFIYPWGNSAPTSSLANYGDIIGDTTKVGSYPLGASPYGVLDMAGNVYEWVYDFYAADYYSSSPSEHPLGPSSGDMRVLKGASFNTSASTIRSANRGRYAPDMTGDDDGFRCMRYSGD